jgi:hypothetical protein
MMMLMMMMMMMMMMMIVAIIVPVYCDETEDNNAGDGVNELQRAAD